LKIHTMKILTICSILIVVLSIICGCPSGISSSRSADRKPIDTNKRIAPHFTATTIDGDTITLADYIGEKAVVVDIWATWCPPCKMEMPLLQKLYDKHSDELEIIAASVDDPRDLAKVQKFVKENKLTFKIVHDESRIIARKYPSGGIPFLTVIDKDGNILKTFSGFNPKIISEIEEILGL